MATIPSVPDEKDTTKVSFAQAVIDALNELNAEAAGSTSQLKNGSFEDVDSGEPVLWTVTDSAGGSHAISDATDSGGEAHHGQRSLQITTTGGGGFAEALSNEFLPVGNGNTVLASGFVRRDTAGIRERLQVLYYDEDQSLSATDTVYDDSGASTNYTLIGGISDTPVGAHFYRIKLIGGESGGAIGGNVFFDGTAAAVLLRPLDLLPIAYSSAGSTSYTVPDGIFAVHITCAGAGGGGGGSGSATGGGGGGSGSIEGHMTDVTPGDILTVNVGAGGNGGAAASGGNSGTVSWVGITNFVNRFVSGSGGVGGGGGGGVGGEGGGGSGWNDGSASPGLPGGAGGDHVYGTQGSGGADGNNGGNATGNSAAGGGGGRGNHSGGDGADGYVIITPHLT